MDKRKLDELSADHERWDNGELGASAEHIGFVSDEEERAIDDGLGLQLISIRLGKPLIEQLKALAKLEGLGYQPLVRQVLTKYVRDNDHKLDLVLSAAEAVNRADKLFVGAIKQRDELTKLAPLSNDRVSAETDYATALREAQRLFVRVYDNCADQVMKQHVKLRMSQISELCGADQGKHQATNYDKAV